MKEYGMAGGILVIDDEKAVRKTFRAILEKSGYKVYTTEDYASAIRIIHDDDPDIVIADIILENQTGMEILRKIRKKGNNCPVIMVTGAPDIKTAAEAVRLGAFDYLTKPVRLDRLIQVVDMGLRFKQLADEKEMLRRNLEAVFRSIPDAIITVSTEGKIIAANAATISVCGFSPETIIGKSYLDTGDDCSADCKSVLAEVLTSRKTIRERQVECRRNGLGRQVVMVNCSPLTDDGNNFSGCVIIIRDITRLSDLERELKERFRFHNLIGNSQKMQEVYNLLEDLAKTDTTVLITGESGTGKELAARALHYEGHRHDCPMVSMNCSALTESFFEKELFGHVKDTFKAEESEKKGRLEIALGGTLFLDEIGDISHSIQIKLLRLLEEKVYRRVGEANLKDADVRIIAATNRNLKELVDSGWFREDLYYRLRVVEVTLPPLRERREDIPVLADHFLEKYREKHRKKVDGFSSAVLETFLHYHWPGNVRELKHSVEHGILLCRDGYIQLRHLPKEFQYEYENICMPKPGRQNPVEAKRIQEVLKQTDGNKSKAARILKISRPTLYRKMRLYHLMNDEE